MFVRKKTRQSFPGAAARGRRSQGTGKMDVIEEAASQFWVLSWVCPVCLKTIVSKKSATGPTERTPKPEYLMALATYFWGPFVRSHSIFDG